jgi:hypothetical protein
MRGLLLAPIVALVALAGACSHGQTTGPAWPAPDKPDPDERDGESLAPHESSTVAAAIEKSDETDAKKDAEPDATPAAATDEKPATVSPPTQPTVDDVIMSDEIIIEIDD